MKGRIKCKTRQGVFSWVKRVKNFALGGVLCVNAKNFTLFGWVDFNNRFCMHVERSPSESRECLPVD